MYRRMLIAYDGSESSRNVLEQALIFARSENAAVEIISVVPGYQGDLRLMGNTSVLDELHASYRKHLDYAVETALARGVRAGASLRTGEPAEEILRRGEEISADILALGRRARTVMSHLPIGSVADEVIRHSDVDVLVIAGSNPLRLENVFLAYDGSEGAEKAARQAAYLAARYGSRLCIGMAYEMDLEAFSLAPDLEERLVEKCRSTIASALETARKADVQHTASAIIHGNPVYEALVSEAKKEDAGLLVTGASGRSGFASVLPNVFLGSVARRILALSAIPVLIVKEQAV